MAIAIKNAEVIRLVEEVASLARETTTEAIRVALEERKLRLQLHSVEIDRGEKAFAFLEREVCPYLSENSLGKRIGKEEVEQILGFGANGV